MAVQSLLEQKMKNPLFKTFPKDSVYKYISLLMKLREAIHPPVALNPIEKYFTAKDGVHIFYQYWIPQSPIEKILIMCHGFQCHSDLYYILADFFFDKNVLVVGMDQRGHGRTFGIRGHLDTFDLIYQDLFLLIQLLKRKYPQIPIYLMGESMGGLTVLNFAARHPNEIAALITLVPGIRAKFSFLLKPLLPFLHLIKLLLNSKPLIKIPSDYNNPTYESAFNEYDANDLLHTNPVSLGLLVNLASLMQDTLLTIKEKITMPILICQGTGDKLLDYHGAYLLYQNVSTSDKTLYLYRNANHSLLMDRNARKIYSDLYSWLKNH
jgi:acylglycerol lipase